MKPSDEPWFPTIYSDKCDGCTKTGKPRCIEFCPNNVFSFKDGKVEVINPAKCGGNNNTFHCSACAPLCPKKAIVFPSNLSSSSSPREAGSKDLLRKITCDTCGKIYWTNSSRNVCFDCEKC
ncbi:MAG TPA: hypothetical protein VK209_11675 [Candidatus Sulfotelmatobacter sp.]|nr:hypothetical protein [Candidatus Sulfotelmatobacter sp.]